jgi:hypothetical protein
MRIIVNSIKFFYDVYTMRSTSLTFDIEPELFAVFQSSDP